MLESAEDITAAEIAPRPKDKKTHTRIRESLEFIPDRHTVLVIDSKPTNKGHPLGREISQNHRQRGVPVIRGERSVVSGNQGPIGGTSNHADHGRWYREYQTTEH